MKVYHLNTPNKIPIAYITSEGNGRTFEVTEDIKVKLTDGREIVINKGFRTDLSSIPSCLWSFFKPFDEALIADIIHDYLWVQRIEEIKYFKGNIYKARKFADDERNYWRKIYAPKKKFKNWITHSTLRLVGGLFYSRQIKIPN